MSEFKNPVIPGFNPDPSVCLVDGIFFAANSSFHVFPAIPIYISYDLVNWKQIGNVISSEDQGIDLTTTGVKSPHPGFVFTNGIYAPTIRYHKGRFYCVCTNLYPTKPGEDFYPRNFVCHTDDIWSGKWSEAHYINDFYAIDPSLFWDHDDKCYLQGAFIYGYDKEVANSIHQFELDPNTGERLSEEYEICAGWSKIVSEVPHMYKKDDWYYLVFAEGGTFEDHMLCAARAKSVKGPFEPYDKNPIATNKHDPEQYVQWVGHGDIFADSKGQYWALVLAARNALKASHPLGRESFLSPVEWPENGWPKVETVKVDMKVSHTLPTNPANIADMVPERFQKSLFEKYLFIRQPNVTNYTYNYPNHIITMNSSECDFSQMKGEISFIGIRQPELVSEFEISVDIASSTLDKNRFGICVYKDPLRFYEFGVDTSANEVYLAAKTLQHNTRTSLIADWTQTHQVKFKVSSTEDHYQFYYSTDESYQLLATLNSADISAAEFTGAIYGVYNFSMGLLLQLTFGDF